MGIGRPQPALHPESLLRGKRLRADELADVIAEPISPELALVDPELAARARRALAVPDVDVALEPPPPAAVSRARVRKPAHAYAAVLLLPSLFVNVLLLRERLDPAPAARPAIAVVAAAEAEQQRPPGVQPPAKAARPPAKVARPAAKAAPQATPRARPKAAARPVRSRPKVARRLLSWPTSRSAVSYDLVLWRGHQRVADVWTAKPRVSVEALRCGRRVAAGTYLWFVYPVRRRAPAQFGPLLKWGRLKVLAGPACR